MFKTVMGLSGVEWLLPSIRLRAFPDDPHTLAEAKKMLAEVVEVTDDQQLKLAQWFHTESSEKDLKSCAVCGVRNPNCKYESFQLDAVTMELLELPPVASLLHAALKKGLLLVREGDAEATLVKNLEPLVTAYDCGAGNSECLLALHECFLDSDIDNNTWVVACSACCNRLEKGVLPKHSVANGRDFGKLATAQIDVGGGHKVPAREFFPELSDCEKYVLATVRPYGHVVKVSVPSSRTTREEAERCVLRAHYVSGLGFKPVTSWNRLFSYLAKG